jgi:hypothetical protein
MQETPNKQAAELRTTPRRPIRCKVKVIDLKGQAFQGESFDLSTGGIGVFLDLHLPIGDTFTVMFAPFTHGSVRSVSVAASVAYCMLSSGGFRTGFQFRNVPAATATVIASIIG